MEDNHNEKINKIIGHRFGRLTVIGASVNGDVLMCKCSCGAVIKATFSDVYDCKVLSCPDCEVCNRDNRKRIVLEYGSLTDYDYASDGVKTCSYCGKPSVYARGLCKACHSRSCKNGDLLSRYVPQDKTERYYAVKRAKRENKRAERVSAISAPRCHYGNEHYEEMRRMYVEDGMTYAQIADKFGLSRQRVYQCLHKQYKRY